MATPETTRLHISPFNPTLFDAVVPKSIQSSATAVSYHQIQTQPERGFGYVELPKSEAEKLRKKLNGMTLRGAKMSVEEARPEKKKRPLATEEEQEEEPEKRQKRVRREKTKVGEFTGYELPEGRQIKRGWTEPGKKAKSSDKTQKREPSKYTRDKELLFKTTNKTKTSTKVSKPSSTETEGTDKAPKKKKVKSGPVVVHEFERTTKAPSFLRSEKPKRGAGALTFVDGQGWVDEDGEVIEAVTGRGARPTEDRGPTQQDLPTPTPAAETPVDSPVGNVVELPDSDAQRTVIERKEVETAAASVASAEADLQVQESTSHSEDVSSASAVSSSSDDSSSEESDASSESDEASSAEDVEDDVIATEESAAPIAEPVQPVALQSEISDEPAPAIHPLEALYKRRKDGPSLPTPIKTSFSFFAEDDNVSENDAQIDIPQTPFTKQDLRVRGLRSAAPTPDTAAIGKRFTFAMEDETFDADETEGRGAVVSPLAEKMEDITDLSIPAIPADEQGESEHAKSFWAKRGDMNRAWKRRRREVTKQERQRENRKTGRRVI